MTRRLTACLLLAIATPLPAATPPPTARWQFDRQHLTDRTITPIAGPIAAQLTGPIRFTQKTSAGPQQLIRLSGQRSPRQRFHVARSIADAKRILPTTAMTVSAWLKIESAGPWVGFVSALQDNGNYEKGWVLGAHDSRFTFGLASAKTGRLTYLTAPRLFEFGHWYHVLGTYDGRLQRLYVDGQLENESKTQSGPITYPPNGMVTLGAYEDQNEYYPIDGLLESASIWHQALSASDIQTVFRNRAGRFPGIHAQPPTVVDWPTYNRDNQRTGISPKPLKLPLSRQWTHRIPTPSPAWPDPARQNFWARKQALRGRVTYDRAPHLVAAAGRVLLGHSADDTVRCLELATGQLLWTVTADGPVRLAPTITKNRVLFGSDDGHIYCVSLADGRRIWKQSAAPRAQTIAGNGRLISAWPVRTGVLVEADVAYCCAGIFPTQGVHQVAFRVSDGHRLAANQVSISAQGYLTRRSGRLFVATGRDPAGGFVAELKRRGKGVGTELTNLPDEYRFAFIGAADLRFGGADGHVAAFDRRTGTKAWSAKVQGRAWSLAIAGGYLLTSTDQGEVTAFGPRPVAKPITHDSRPEKTPTGKTAPPVQWVATLVKELAHKKGYAVVLGSTDANAGLELARHSQIQIHVLLETEQQAARARKTIWAKGLAGQVTAVHSPSEHTPRYVDGLFNIALIPHNAKPSTQQTADRLVRPWGGAVVDLADGTILSRRAALPGAGHWSHMYANAANTVCSDDQHVKGPLDLQWFGPPGPRQMLDRHHRTVAPLFVAGRLFIPGNDRVIAVDGYNGTVLWNNPVPGSRRIGAFRDCSYLAATEDSVYIAAGGRCLRLDGDTGRTLTTFAVPTAADGKPRDWGYLAVVGNTLVGSAVATGASRRDHSRDAIDGTYYDRRPLVGSEYLFAFDRHSGRHLWSYHTGGGLLPNPAIAIADSAVTLIESDNTTTLTKATGRATPKELFAQGARLVSLDLATGSVRFSRPHDFSAIQHSVYLSVANGRLVVVGSRNDGDNSKTSRVCYDIQVFDSKHGDQLWTASQKQSTAIGGSHGEQDHHPVIVGSILYCEPFAWNLGTGKRVTGFLWKNKHRRGCGTLTASASTVFFRDATASMFDLESNTYRKVTTSTRPGCWVNMIPAGGLLLVPEASSGCTCNFAIQTSLAFRPRKP